MELKYKIWLETKKEGKLLFGRGRLDLLEALEEEKSLNAAAKKLGMSYRAAWGRLRASEERLGISLVRPVPGKKCLELTDEARKIIDRFRKINSHVSFLLHEAQAFLDELIEEQRSCGTSVPGTSQKAAPGAPREDPDERVAERSAPQ